MHSLDLFAEAKLQSLETRRLKRTLRPTHRLDGVSVERDGRRLISFSCNDYLCLSHHPAVKAAAHEAIETYGAGAGASRLVTGDHPLISVLEDRLARFKGTEAACVFGSGYLANAGIIPTLAGPGDLVLVDELAHACIWAGAKLSGAKVVGFAHNSAQVLEALLTEHRDGHDRVIVATDTVFSMDGDLAPLGDLAALCDSKDAWLLVDDAHGIGVLGDGRGAARLFPDARIPLQMGTLSKAIGSYGGYLCASRPVVDLIKTRARTLIYSTGLPPASVGAAIAALNIISDHPDLCAMPLRQAHRFKEALGLARAESPIVPVVIGDAAAALEASHRLAGHGFLVVAIRPPTVPVGTARLRFAFTAGHSDDDVDRLASVTRMLVQV